MRRSVPTFGFFFFAGCFFLQSNQALAAPASRDTLPTNSEKTVIKVSHHSETNQYIVRYADGTSEVVARSTLDERKIFFPGRPQGVDTAVFYHEDRRASVDSALWIDHLQKHLPTYVNFAHKRGLHRGTYEVVVRFFVDENGTLSDFSASPNPGYRFVEFMEAIFKNGPKWQPAQQNGKKIKSYRFQPVTFRITNHLDAL